MTVLCHFSVVFFPTCVWGDLCSDLTPLIAAKRSDSVVGTSLCAASVSRMNHTPTIRRSHQLASAHISSEVHLLLLCPSLTSVVRHRRHGGHRRDGRGSRPHHGPAGWPLAAHQHLHLAASRQQAAQHPAHLPASASAASRPAAQPQRRLRPLRLRGRSRERREDVHPQGGKINEEPEFLYLNISHSPEKWNYLPEAARNNP